MKKNTLILGISALFILSLLPIRVQADTNTPSDFAGDFPNRFYGRVYDANVNRYTWTFVMSADHMSFDVSSDGFTVVTVSGSDWWDIQKEGLADCPSLSDSDWYHLYWTNNHNMSFGTVFDAVIAVGDVTVNSNVPVYNSPYDYQESLIPTPSEPVPGDDWISDMWDWILYVLGFGDDPAIIQITGGDKVETEIVTPTPSPSPTPIPTPTPYSLNVIDPSTGQPVYTITGIPSNTYNIYGGDTTNNGSDFDIFEVDLKIGNGGTSKPKDDLNEVMKTNNDYIQEMNVSAVKDSFSVLPSDWFLMLGVLASMPIIAGIISKMLK